jgi:hypothetical protein
MERTRVLPPAPGMETTRREPQEPQDRSQREVLAGKIDGAQDPRLVGSFRQALLGEPKPGASEQGQHKPEQRRELLDASAQLQDLTCDSCRDSLVGTGARRRPKSACNREPWR